MTATGRPWAVELLAPKRAGIPWGLSIEAGVAVGGAFTIALLTGHTVDGLLAALGALPVAAGDRGGPFRTRAQRIVGGGLAVAVGIYLGALARGVGWEVVLLGAGVAAAAGLMSSFSPVWSVVALNLLTYAAISGSDALPSPAWRTALIALGGAGFKLLVSLPRHLVAPRREETAALSAVYRCLAALLAGADADDRRVLRQAVTTALNSADDAMAALRIGIGGPNARDERLLLVYEASHPLTAAAVERLAARRRASPTSAAAVADLADALATGTAAGSAPPDDADLVDPWAAARRAVDGQVDAGDRRWAVPLRQLWAQRLVRAGGRRSLQATFRLVLCVAVAEAVASYTRAVHPYWIPLTVAVAMKPDFGSVFARAVQRSVGTLVGVGIGALVLLATTDPRDLVPAFVVLAALLPVTVVRNYGMFTTCLTPLVFILLDSLEKVPGQLLAARVVDTLVGACIVLVLGYAVWPSTWRPRLRLDLAAAVAAVRTCLDTAAAGDGAAFGQCRRSTYRALSDLRTTWAQHFADPSPIGRQARILWPALTSLERVADEAVRIEADHDVDPGELQRASAALGAVADGGPGPALHHGGGPAAPLWDHVAEVAAALRREPPDVGA